MTEAEDLEQFALLLEIDADKFKRLTYKHYCIWLMKHIYIYSNGSNMVRQNCLNLCYDLVHSNNNYYSGIDFLWMKHPYMMPGWVRMYHDQYFKQSCFYGK